MNTKGNPSKPRRLDPIQYPVNQTTESQIQPQSPTNKVSSPTPSSPNNSVQQILSPRTQKIMKKNTSSFSHSSPSSPLRSDASPSSSFPTSSLSGAPLPYDPRDPGHSSASNYDELPPLLAPTDFEQHLSDARILAQNRVNNHKKKQNPQLKPLETSPKDNTSKDPLQTLRQQSNEEKIKLMRLRTNHRVELYMKTEAQKKQREQEEKETQEAEKKIKDFLYQNDDLVKLRMKEIQKETQRR